MKAKRSLGQNFLTGGHYPRRIVDSVPLRPGETVVEIGPGRGALTRPLLERCRRIEVIEIGVPAQQATADGKGNGKAKRKAKGKAPAAE